MPYWNPKETKAYDRNGVEIKHGDVLEKDSVDLGHGERFQICFTSYWNTLEVRDIGNNNVGMCSVSIDGSKSDVVNLGHWTKNLDKLDASDIASYFFDSENDNAVYDAQMIIDSIKAK